ncbi:Asp23/Gls24 family envelope stress response protein [Nocardia higoensis]|uniref:Asp23/Gls24 family envelope stress response protein n=1 Tax=Nocardia higoensis TaxID=228599 RepID=UPI0012F6EEBD|nr:Asp23/Gls24 family envelope stress response protein [Nocardia higoensis]
MTSPAPGLRTDVRGEGDSGESSSRPVGEDDTASHRGTLDIRSRAVKRIAEHAALETPGVLAHAGGLDRITGRDFPRSRAVTSADRVRVWLEIAVAWPSPLAELARQVQRNVAVALGDYAGLRVDGVEVVVAHVLVADTPTRSIE